MSDTEENSKWQPAMVVLRGGGRLECQCGALAVVVIGTLDEDEHLNDVDYWCQYCYLKEQQKANDGDVQPRSTMIDKETADLLAKTMLRDCAKVTMSFHYEGRFYQGVACEVQEEGGAGCRGGI